VAPSHALAFVRASVKRWQGYVQAGLVSREINGIGVPTLSRKAEGHILGSVYRELSGDPARSMEPGHARNLHAREQGGPMVARRVDRRSGRARNAEAARS
jgi:hypothetical protein